jgi:hypothetical protein
VGIVALVGFIFAVSGGNGDAALSFFRRFVNFVHALFLSLAFESQDMQNSRRQCGFAVVNVADGADVHVRFSSFVFFCCHSFLRAATIAPPADEADKIRQHYTGFAESLRILIFY